MPPPSFWSRIRSGQLIQVLAIYLGASWVLLQVVNELSADAKQRLADLHIG